MLAAKMRQRLGSMMTNQPKKSRRRKACRQSVLFDAPAEALESRELLTAAGVPYLVFAVQPQNSVAGHTLSFTVDVMIRPNNKFGAKPVIDTAFSGLCAVVPFTPTTSGTPTVFDTPYNYLVTPGPNSPVSAVVMSFVNGVASTANNELPVALDVAGTYQLSAITSDQVSQLSSHSFTISAFTATDHLGFVKAPSEVTVDTPFSATVAVEDQYGNIDTSVNNVPITLIAAPGNISKSEIMDGEATFNDAYFVASGDDLMLAVATPPTGAPLIGSAAVLVFDSNGGLGGSR
jgi:hypothetical protein